METAAALVVDNPSGSISGYLEAKLLLPKKVDRMVAETRSEQLLESTKTTWPEMDGSVYRLVNRIGRLSELLDRDCQRHLDRADLTKLEYDVLSTLRKADPPHAMRPSDLCQLALASSGGMSIALKKLRTRNLVSLETAPRDARSKIVQLTGEGKKLIESVSGAILEEQELTLGRVATDDVLEGVAGGLRRLLSGIDRQPI